MHDQEDAPLGADVPLSHWHCEHCGEQNSELDSECQYCDGADVQPDQPDYAHPEDDPAWRSEARLRDMEGTGDYEGPRNWL